MDARTLRPTSNPNIFTAQSASEPGIVYALDITRLHLHRCPGVVYVGRCWHRSAGQAIADDRAQRARAAAIGKMLYGR